MKKATPADLGRFTSQTINHSKHIYFPPPESVIIELMETLYFASMQSEEGELIKVNVTFLDPEAPKGDSRVKEPLDNWKLSRFEKPIPMEIKNVVKLSKAADPWSSSLAVYFDAEEKPWIMGLVDQAVHIQRFFNHEDRNKPALPGVFQVQVTGVGIMSVIFDYELIATIRQNVLVTRFSDVLKYGQISRAILADTMPLKKRLAKYMRKNFNRTNFKEWEREIENTWRDTISRILIQIRNYHHGGAVLITDQTDGLDVKYKMPYPRLAQAIRHALEWSMGSAMYNQDFLQYPDEPIDQDTFFESELTKHQLNTAGNELKGAIRFLASQSCVDGLVLLNHQLEGIGFGVVISEIALPDFVYHSENNEAKPGKLIPRAPDTLGTRHRSMMSFCWKDPQAIGFVVSQDGDIRAFKRVDDQLVMWENIKTQKYLKSKNILNDKIPVIL
ncbi:putative sensor domain DACNV-containing protein [Mucilaginibacter celer]|uniref:Probable sensor domain-containing protein n=1 Tax=Mucilaginibacter celer TaxID=2305508 RepID=A0A494VHP4_9SPHI|nr:hypothetical protein [Mucilaginibacter celer]AYL94266.1 hypothetical protein HYN43_002685 [Mucilaginibacter celer]